MPTTPNMGLVMPTEDGDFNTWDVILNDLFERIDLHDHTTGLGVPIPSAALKINADVAWSFGGSNYAITALKALDFTPIAAASAATYASALFSNSDDSSNLYFRNASGVNVQITSGNTLNISAAGAIGGDYSSIGALLDYDDGSDTYRARQQNASSVRQFAKFATADLVLTEYQAAGVTPVPSNTVTIKSPAALAASYAITMPAALPAATTELFVSSAGVATFTAPQRTKIYSAIGGIGSSTYGTVSGASIIRTGASGGTYYRPIDFDAGHRIVNIRVRLSDTAGTTCTVRLLRDVDGTQSAISTIGTSSGAGGYQTLTASAVNHTIATGGQYVIAFTFAGGAANCDLNKIEIDYDRP